MPPLYPRGVMRVSGATTVGAMDLRAWLLDAHADLRSRLDHQVVQRVPMERWHELADGGGSSTASLLLHLARHHDLALTTAIRNKAPLYLDHAHTLGLAHLPTSTGLAEAEDRAATTIVDPAALLAYVNATFDSSRRWLQRLSAMALESIPDTPRRLEHKALLDPAQIDWLFDMWTGRTVNWFVQWPILGHAQSHLGEAVSVRNRLGLSPF